MQIIYLLPFGLLSVVTVVVCSIMPRWRRYVFAAAVAPIAFAVCAITGLLLISLSAEAVGIDRVLGINAPLDASTAKGWLILGLFYFVTPGAVGAYVAARISNTLQRWYLAHRL